MDPENEAQPQPSIKEPSPESVAMKATLQTAVRNTYDLQMTRIGMGGRLVAQFKKTLGIKPGDVLPELPPLEGAEEAKTLIEAEEVAELEANEVEVENASESEKDKKKKEAAAKKEAKKLLERIKKVYKRMTDGVAKGIHNRTLPSPNKFMPFDIIQSYDDLVLVDSYIRVLQDEEKAFLGIAHLLTKFQIYHAFLKDVNGIGPALAGIIISEFNPYIGKHVSSFWKYSGYDCAPEHNHDKEGNIIPWPDGSTEPHWTGRSRRKEHLVERPYIDRKGEKKIRMGITFNPLVKTKLYVMAGCLIKAKGGSKYRDIYYSYKNRLEQRPDLKDIKHRKGHIHGMSMRYMIKMVLQDLWICWRTVEGLPVSKPYREAKLGMPPHEQAA